VPDVTSVAPDGYTLGPVTVTAAVGVAQSATDFAVVPPALTAFAIGAAGQQPTGLAVGDFNGDGKLDAATADYGSNTVTVLFGAGDGTFLSPTLTIPLPSYAHHPFGIAVGKLTPGSDALSIVTANGGESGVCAALIRGNGDGTFQAAQPVFYAHPFVQVAVGDVDGDNLPDIVGASTDGTCTVNLSPVGSGRGAEFSLSTPIFGVAIAKFHTGSGPKPGVVVAAYAAGKIGVVPGNGDGTFAAPIFTDVGGQNDKFLAVGDFNHDGKADVATSNQDSNTVSVLLGNGNGTFLAAATYAVGATPMGITVGDVNNDGNADLIVTDFGSDAVSVLMGDGTGAFAPELRYAAGTHPTAVAMGAFTTGEATPDIVAALDLGHAHDLVTLASNKPTITGFTPTNGPAGTQVVITGTNFVNVAAVAFNGKRPRTLS